MNQAGNWFCAQMGAREHYAIPRALHSKGALGGLMTDYWAGTASQLMAKHLPNKATKSLAARFHKSIPSHLVHSWNLRALTWEARLRDMTRRGGVTGRYLAYCDVGKRFSTAVMRSLDARGTLPDCSVFFGYDTCSLEVMQRLKEDGVICILGQIDPCRVEIDMVLAEQEIWPEWPDQILDVPEKFYRRHQDEWEVADRIIVNSEFSRNALVQQGIPSKKLEVVPLSYEPSIFLDTSKIESTRFLSERKFNDFTKERPLHVLFLGQVVLRKGIQYLVEAARLLTNSPVVFNIVGPIHISEKAIKSAPKNVLFHGRATRDDVALWYQNSHVFVLPTLSDGFAITQIESMAYGLPVIATPNCGLVVSDGVDGFLVSPRCPQSIVAAICKYIESPTLLALHQRSAIQKSTMFSSDRLGANLQAIEAKALIK